MKPSWDNQHKDTFLISSPHEGIISCNYWFDYCWCICFQCIVGSAKTLMWMDIKWTVYIYAVFLSTTHSIIFRWTIPLSSERQWLEFSQFCDPNFVASQWIRTKCLCIKYKSVLVRWSFPPGECTAASCEASWTWHPECNGASSCLHSICYQAPFPPGYCSRCWFWKKSISINNEYTDLRCLQKNLPQKTTIVD